MQGAPDLDVVLFHLRQGERVVEKVLPAAGEFSDQSKAERAGLTLELPQDSTLH